MNRMGEDCHVLVRPHIVALLVCVPPMGGSDSADHGQWCKSDRDGTGVGRLTNHLEVIPWHNLTSKGGTPIHVSRCICYVFQDMQC